MKAIVVYESHWGNTEAIAQAIATGFGPGLKPSRRTKRPARSWLTSTLSSPALR